MLDDVSGNGADHDGLPLAQVDQVGSDLSAVVARRLPAKPQAGGRRVEWQRLRVAVLVLLFLLLLVPP